MESFPQFNPDVDKNTVGARWIEYKSRLTRFLVTKHSEKIASIADEVLVANVLHYTGPKVAKLYDTVGQATDKYDDVIKKIDNFFNAKVHVDYERFVFWSAHQEKDEPFEAFVNRLRVLIQYCDYSDPEREIKTKAIIGCADQELRYLGITKEFKPSDFFDLGIKMEKGKQQSQNMSQDNTVAAINTRKPMSTGTHSASNTMNKKKFGNKNVNSHNNEKNQQRTQINCNFCGKSHAKGKNNCPANGKTCNKCKKSNHFANVCRSTACDKPVANVVQDEDQGDDDDDQLNAFAISQRRKKFPKKVVTINDTESIEMYIDTCCSLNIIDEVTFNSLKYKPQLSKLQEPIWGYQNQKPLEFLGEFKTSIKWSLAKVECMVAVVRGREKCLLGYDTADELGIVKIVNTVINDEHSLYWERKYPTVFSGKVGKMRDYKVSFNIDRSVKPTVHTRVIPFNLRDKMMDIVKKGVSDGVFEKVNGPVDWLLIPLLVPKADGRLRFVLDATPANIALKRTYHSFPTIEDFMVSVNGSKIFSKIDLVDGFHQIELDEESRKMTNFMTPEGIHRYTRLTQGFKPVPEEYDRAMKINVRDRCEGVVGIMDDMLVHGKDTAEHDQRLDMLLKRLSELGLTVNMKKCKFNQTSIEFYGLVFDARGVRLTFDKIQALKEANAPGSGGEIKSLLGLSTFCSKWIQNHATTVEPLRKLANSKTWNWTEVEERALKDLKEAATGKILSYFDPNFETELVVDASPVGLGAMLRQINPKDSDDKRVLAYASRALSLPEQKYSQIEKECLAIVWGCEKFHIYLYGRPFNLKTDNQALVYLLGSTKKKRARLERLALDLLAYDFKVSHTPGKENPVDYLSRNPLSGNQNADDEIERYVNYVFAESLPISISYDEVVKETKADNVLQELIRRIRGAKINNNKRISREYDSYMDELTVTSENVILKQNMIVIPSSLIQRVISLAHDGHQGVNKTIALLKTKVWFPNMRKLVESTISNCAACELNYPRTYYEPLRMSPMPDGPWENLSIDYYGPTPSGTKLFVLLDEYSRYVIVREVESEQVDLLIPELHQIWSQFGIPKSIKSDNGATFISKPFRKMCESFGIKQRLITPYWPRANGEVERFNRNINKIIRVASTKQSTWREELYFYIGAYLATPHSSTGIPPAQLIFRFNRTARLVNISKHKDFQKSSLDEIAVGNDKAAKSHIEIHGNKHLRVTMNDFKIGDLVLLQDLNQKFKRKTNPKRRQELFKIVAINHSMVSAKSMLSDKIITRNSSFFKKTTSNVGDNISVSRAETITGSKDVNNGQQIVQPGPVQISNRAVTGPTRIMTRANRGQISRLQVDSSKKIYEYTSN